jgi:hypothetical protein
MQFRISHLWNDFYERIPVTIDLVKVKAFIARVISPTCAQSYFEITSHQY